MEKVLDSNYIETFEKWETQKKRLLTKYIKQYEDRYTNIKIIRVKTDTKGLRCYYVYGKKRGSEE